jgi:hypothetical protein
MALYDSGMKTTLGGIAIGVGVAVAAPIVFPILASIVKPMTKAVIKQGLILFNMGRETVTGAKEALEDLTAEAKSEIVASAATTRAASKKKKVSPVKSKPVAKAIMDESKALYKKGRGAIMEAKESVEQMVEEARSEIAISTAAKKS